MSHSRSKLSVEVVYALAENQILVRVEVEEGATVIDAIERSGILARFPGLTPRAGHVGVFGRPVQLNARLRDGDRVELYRPLIADPREARRRRARRRR